MEVSCQCGDVVFRTPADRPMKVYHCHCNQCRKQSASAYGTTAIFPAAGIFPLSNDLKAKLQVWTRPTDSGNTMDCYFCKTCGVRLLHKARERDKVSIKGGCVKDLFWKDASHIWCRSAVVAIPEDAVKWDAEPHD